MPLHTNSKSCFSPSTTSLRTSRQVSRILPVLSQFASISPPWAHWLTRTRYHVPHNVSHHIDYITPGIKLMSGGREEKVLKRKVGRRHLTGDLRGKARKGGKWKGKGNGRGKCKPPKPVDPGQDDSIFKATGPCSDEITPQCIRSKFSSYRTGPLLTVGGEFEANPCQPSIKSPTAPRPPKATNSAYSRA